MHTTTLFAVADTITHNSHPLYDLLLWCTVFQHTFNRSVKDKLAEKAQKIWVVDARWSSSARVTFIDWWWMGPVHQ